ncbi:MAG: ABC transporter ATP-binding protein [Henriciella sp.]|uniref:ABC transporter ATP-binding protein n=1 Tax=Henriciella sp. TaxID=1968823 RepID=UPI003C70FB16
MALITLNNISLRYTSKAAKRLGAMDAGADELDIAGPLERRSGRNMRINALQDVSLTLRDGTRLGIIGSNGSGKTTLLRVLGGLFVPQEGDVTLSGRVATMFTLGIGMSAEASGLQNIYLSGLVAGASRKQIKQILPDIMSFTGLGDYIHLPISTYSQGMAMRLKFACATAFQPDIILLDEWIGAGDESFQEKAQARLEKILADAGIIVVASHNIKLIQDVTTEVLWLERGQVKMLGPTQEVLDARGAERRKAAEQAADNAKAQARGD